MRWLEVVADLEAAKLRVKELVECVPGEYFIFSLASGRRFDDKRDDVRASSEKRRDSFENDLRVTLGDAARHI